MNITFRTDSSLQIGSGHIMRCLTLADELRQRGAEVTFVCREYPGNMIGLIETKGYPVVRLAQAEAEYAAAPDDLTHAAWLGVPWQQDASDTITAVRDARPQWLIIDHYALDHRWEELLRPHVGKIMVIDDLADRAHDCELLLDQNFGRTADAYGSLVPEGCNLLLGAQYALLRPEFAVLREYSLNRRKNPSFNQLLVTMGGVDKDNVTGDILNALKDCELPDNCRIKVVMGPTAPWLDSVSQQAKCLPWDVEVKINVADMARIMAESDLAIGAAGGTSWERCCLGLPTIMLVIARNQEIAARQLEQVGAAILLDRDWQPCQLRSILQTVFLSPSTIYKMVVSASKIADGKGASSVLKFLIV